MNTSEIIILENDYWKKIRDGYYKKFQHKDYLYLINKLRSDLQKYHKENKRLHEIIDKQTQKGIINQYV